MKALAAIFIIFCLGFINGCKGKSEKLKDHSKRQVETVVSSGFKLNYFIEGSGYPCIVVSEGEAISKAISKELKNHFKFIFLNSRYNIADQGITDKVTFDLLADDVDQVRRSLRLEKTGVIGISLGGLIALEYARKYPQNTTFVIMNGTPPYFNEHLMNIAQSYWEANASEERKIAYTEKMKIIYSDSLNILNSSDAGILTYILNGPKYWFDYNYDATPLFKDTYWNMSLFNCLSALMSTYDIEQDKPVEVPVFLALGKHDYVVPYMSWDDQKEKIPNLAINLFEKSGHWSFLEEEELFRKRVIDWFENLKIKN
jgi:proline iminopeptidase